MGVARITEASEDVGSRLDDLATAFDPIAIRATKLRGFFIRHGDPSVNAGTTLTMFKRNVIE
jgi:hypothetical protein